MNMQRIQTAEKFNIPPKVRDFRGSPKSWQDKGVIRHIRKFYTTNLGGRNKRLRTALAIYLVLTELASNQQSEEFNAAYSTIGDYVGVSRSTARRYTDEFIKIRVLEKENIKKGKANLSNRWILLSSSKMVFACVQNNKHTILNSDTKIKDIAYIQNNRQTPMQNNGQE